MASRLPWRESGSVGRSMLSGELGGFLWLLGLILERLLSSWLFECVSESVGCKYSWRRRIDEDGAGGGRCATMDG